ncbi:hypothetical protein PIROE2DRAFT_4868 [Piromyces sp. E2]|nr:hypothetical protein PIROE2DRAFT_4868 [Piromyces sp. E2]|eukprot:OUM67584.1 hypothetical protein PIROE2DRAFT_4868 [Piromyces sp. E2]
MNLGKRNINIGLKMDASMPFNMTIESPGIGLNQCFLSDNSSDSNSGLEFLYKFYNQIWDATRISKCGIEKKCGIENFGFRNKEE